jgi:hypothetical protein
MTVPGPNVSGREQPPRRVFKDARAAFREVFTGRLLVLVGRLQPDQADVAGDGAREAGSRALVFKDDDVVVFVSSRRVTGGSALATEIFGTEGTTTAMLRRPASRHERLVRRLGHRFVSGTVSTGPACLVIESDTGAAMTTWHADWVTL